MKKINNIGNYVVAMIFIGIILIGLFFNRGNLIEITRQLFIDSADTQAIEESFDSNFQGEMHFVNLNGFASNILNQKITNEVVKGSKDNLYLNSQLDENFDLNFSKKSSLEPVLKVYSFAKEKNINIIYASEPQKLKAYSESLPYDFEMQWDRILDYRLENLEGKMPTIDLDEALKGKIQFYKTDHHWTVETSFYAAQAILNKLNVNTDNLSDNLFEKETYKDCFLSSSGIRTGKYYAGEDSISFLIPKYKTNFSFKHYIAGELDKEKSGDFKQSFIDYDIINNKDYYNKYNACLNGAYYETRIINKEIDSKRKVLIIADSFARPMTQYVSLCYKETRYLDPQDGRYNENYIEYIKKYKPDDIIIMCFVPINVGKE